MKKPMTAVERFKTAIEVNRFRMDEELEMISILLNKYNFLSVSEYARKEKISQPGALKRLKTGKVMFVEMIGRKFIIG